MWMTCVAAVFMAAPALSADEATLDELSSSVVRLVDQVIETAIVDGAEYEVWLRDPSGGDPSPHLRTVSGTAFFVRTREHLYLVTAEHVARAMSGSCRAILMGVEHRPDTLALAELVGAAKPPTWLVHPEADAALLPLAPAPGTLTSATGVVPVTRAMLWAEPIPPSRDIPVTMLGFPMGLGSTGTFSPLSRETKIASGWLEYPRADTGEHAQFLFLQDPSVGGYSGSPVLDTGQIRVAGATIAPGGRCRCLGLVHGTVADLSGGKFAAVVPAIKIVELIRDAEAAVATSN